MDKKNTVIGALLIAAAFVAIYFSPKPVPPPPAAPIAAPAPAATPATAGTAVERASATNAPTAPAAPVNPTNAAFAAVASDAAGATITTLANDFIAVNFTDFGGAVRDVAFRIRDTRDHLVYPAELGGATPFVFNALHADPMLALVDYPGLDRHVRFERVSQTSNEVVYRAVLDGRLEVTRRYSLAPNAGDGTDPYQIHHETTFRNLTAQTATLPLVALSIGTAAPTDARDLGDQLTTGSSNGKDQNFVARRGLEGGSGFFGMGASEQKSSVASPGPLAWTAVGNKFFTTILTPAEPAAGLVTRRVKLVPDLPDTNFNAYGLTGATQFNLKPLAPQGETKLALDFYVGPKEYSRLANAKVFKSDQDRVMQFGFFKFFSALLVTVMGWMHRLAPGLGWGFAIVFTTLSLKVISLPLTIKASRSMKRMAKLQPFMKEIREKYKDNPAKQQTAMMELYKEHKVNPMGGCLPMLIPMPFFFGFFTMLRSTAELRFAPFLWATDLSAADTVGHVFGVPINILPLILGVTMIVQMRLTPQPTVDNAQATMMKIMPLFFVWICYSYSCALSLYSTANGLFTIFQQIIINRMKDPADTPVLATAGGKTVKNVTPKNKK